MFSGPWQQTVTRILILVSALVWIGWDCYTYYTAGNPSTESATIWRWAYQMPGIAFIAGVLSGHFFFQMREPTAYPESEQSLNVSIKNLQERLDHLQILKRDGNAKSKF